AGLLDCGLITMQQLHAALFPYTTLFRSRPVRRVHAHRADAARLALGRRRGGDVRAARVPDALVLPSEPEGLPWHPHHQRAGDCEDRKSTRLNSSHVKITYAVFCLKKKRK